MIAFAIVSLLFSLQLFLVGSPKSTDRNGDIAFGIVFAVMAAGFSTCGGIALTYMCTKCTGRWCGSWCPQEYVPLVIPV